MLRCSAGPLLLSSGKLGAGSGRVIRCLGTTARQHHSACKAASIHAPAVTKSVDDRHAASREQSAPTPAVRSFKIQETAEELGGAALALAHLSLCMTSSPCTSELEAAYYVTPWLSATRAAGDAQHYSTWLLRNAIWASLQQA